MTTTGLKPVTLGDLNKKGSLARDWFAVVGEDGLPAGSKGLQSGQLIQATLEGTTPHYMTTTGVTVLGDTHTSAELRGLLRSQRRAKHRGGYLLSRGGMCRGFREARLRSRGATTRQDCTKATAVVPASPARRTGTSGCTDRACDASPFYAQTGCRPGRDSHRTRRSQGPAASWTIATGEGRRRRSRLPIVCRDSWGGGRNEMSSAASVLKAAAVAGGLYLAKAAR